MKIKNAIFDLGNVVFEININAFSEEINKLCNTRIDFFEIIKKDLVFKFDCGLISKEDFIESFNKHFNLNIDKDTFERAWNKIIIKLNPDIERILKILRKKNIRIFALSNTNEIHEDYLNTNFKYIISLFEKMHYSHKLNLVKPFKEIFLKVIEINQIVPEETVFFDDIIENINTAKELGFNTCLVRKFEDIENYLKEIKLL